MNTAGQGERGREGAEGGSLTMFRGVSISIPQQSIIIMSKQILHILNNVQYKSAREAGKAERMHTVKKG
jgi:hypothetical protein